jgi:hypothetical protein
LKDDRRMEDHHHSEQLNIANHMVVEPNGCGSAAVNRVTSQFESGRPPQTYIERHIAEMCGSDPVFREAYEEEVRLWEGERKASP